MRHRTNDYAEKECEGCKAVFRARIRDGRVQRFCSRACQRQNWPTKVEITCEWCKQTFLYDKRTVHSERAKLRRFCSHDCKLSHWRAHGKSQPLPKERRVMSSGYVDVHCADHPSVQGKAYKRVYEHRLVMEKVLGRPLAAGENVHHKDGNRANNDPSNLELWIKPQPNGHLPDYANELVAARLRILALEAQLSSS